eukprot:2261004-Prymnesium_polylepis.2
MVTTARPATFFSVASTLRGSLSSGYSTKKMRISLRHASSAGLERLHQGAPGGACCWQRQEQLTWHRGRRRAS